MGIMLKSKPGQQVPPGTHFARCFRIVDVGTQPDSGFGEKQKILISWELPHERITIDGKEKPMGVTKIYTNSLNKKAALRQDLDRWRGRSFTKEELEGWELKKILGVACQLSVVATEDGERTKVDSVMALPKGIDVPPCINPIVEYSIEEEKNDTYKKLPEFIQKMCNDCLEWNPENRQFAEGKSKEAEPDFPPDDPDGDPVPF